MIDQAMSHVRHKLNPLFKRKILQFNLYPSLNGTNKSSIKASITLNKQPAFQIFFKLWESVRVCFISANTKNQN